MNQPAFQLRVISGPNSGSDLPLEPATYRVGRGDHCDIILDDATIAEEHLTLIVTEHGVEIERVHGSLQLDGHEFTGGQLPVRQPLLLGTTQIAIATAEDREPIHPQPVAINPEMKPESEANETKPEKKVSLPNRYTQIVTAVSISLIIAVLSLLIVSNFTSDPSEDDQAQQTVEEQLWEIVKTHQDSSNLKIEQNRRGWTVAGYVRTREEKEQLEEEFEELLPADSIRIFDSESLAIQAGNVLRALDLDLLAQPGEKVGEVLVKGIMNDLSAWESQKSRLLSDVPDILRLVDEVMEPGAEPAKTLTSTAARQTRPLPRPPRTTNVPNSPRPSARQKRQAAARASSPPSAPKPELNIESISVGSASWIVLQDGLRLMPGGRIDGWMIVNIDDEKVTLEKNQYRYFVRYRDP